MDTGFERARFVAVLFMVLVIGSSARAQRTSVLMDQTSLVSVDSQGNQGNDFSGTWGSAQISGDGRFSVFNSDATNLVPDDTNNLTDIFVYDRLMGTTIRVSVSSTGRQANGYSTTSALSADGRYVTFDSEASNLVPGDTNQVMDVFVHDLITGDTVRVSVDSQGNQANDSSARPSISADGRYVAFHSFASNLIPGDTNSAGDVFVHDRLTGVTSMISVDSQGNQGNGDSVIPAISSDGRFVAFDSDASTLVSGDTNGDSDVFVHDRQTGDTTRVSVDSAGNQVVGWSGFPSVSNDGRLVAFMSWAKTLVPEDRNGSADVFINDRLTGETTRVSVNSGGHEGKKGDSGYPSISGDGRYIAFESSATGLVPPGPWESKFTTNIFVHDCATRETMLVSAACFPEEQLGGSAESSHASISADGRFIAFESWNAALVTGDTNENSDVLVRGPELTLDADPTVVVPGQILTLTEYKSVPGHFASLWAVDVNGTPVSLLIVRGTIGDDGNFLFSSVVPPGLSGNTVAFRGYAVGQAGIMVRTNDRAVLFR